MKIKEVINQGDAFLVINSRGGKSLLMNKELSKHEGVIATVSRNGIRLSEPADAVEIKDNEDV